MSSSKELLELDTFLSIFLNFLRTQTSIKPKNHKILQIWTDPSKNKIANQKKEKKKKKQIYQNFLYLPE